MRTFAMWSAAVLAMASSWPLAVVADEPTAADYYVRDLPGLPADVSPVKMHAG